VSNVFHSLPHSQNHLSSFRGDQPQSGQRMRGLDGSCIFSSSSSRFKTTDHLAVSFKGIQHQLGEEPILGEFDGSRTLLIVRHSIKQTAFRPNSTLTAVG
jgi:hypothetical protein